MLEAFQAASVGINTLVLLILVFKYLQDMRRQRLDMQQQRLAMEKLRYELERMQADVRAKQGGVIHATDDDIKKYVVEPLAEEIRKASLQLRNAAHDSASALSLLVARITEAPSEAHERQAEIMRAQINMMDTIHGDLRQLVAMLAPVQKLAIGLRSALDGLEAPPNSALPRT